METRSLLVAMEVLSTILSDLFESANKTAMLCVCVQIKVHGVDWIYSVQGLAIN